MYTSYEANFPSHESHDMASRLFMISEIDSTLVTVTLDCIPDIEVIRNRLADMNKFTSLVFSIDINRLYS